MGTTNKHPSLSDSAVRELLTERDRAAAERDRAEGERKKWDALLANINTLLAAANGASPHIPGKSIRDGIIEVLRQHPKGLRPLAVTKKLEELGYVATGATPLTLLVSNNLFRMARVGLARRERNRRYRLAENEAASE